MSGFDSQLKELYLNKPECVINLPTWLLTPQRIEAYRALPRLAIVEVAGRDAVAAAVKSVEEDGFTDLLPVYGYTGTEHGPWSSVEEATARLTERLPQVRVHGLLAMGSPGFWHALNGRFINELISRYGFHSPCIGCHLYLHCIRIPLALTLGNAPIISGEREKHNDTVKVNQTCIVLNTYQDLAEEFGIRLLLPLRGVEEGDRIEDILGFEWREGEGQLGCVLSRNYQRLDASLRIPELRVQRYLEEFAVPCAREIIKSYASGRISNHVEVAARILAL
ncbi:MAG: hypothetical protein SV775_03460 [Thermodesulfobacteriota bacterium]|nr:hypothetical protein [Thermodesulfobacteriota bacterium]